MQPPGKPLLLPATAELLVSERWPPQMLGLALRLPLAGYKAPDLPHPLLPQGVTEVDRKVAPASPLPHVLSAHFLARRCWRRDSAPGVVFAPPANTHCLLGPLEMSLGPHVAPLLSIPQVVYKVCFHPNCGDAWLFNNTPSLLLSLQDAFC